MGGTFDLVSGTRFSGLVRGLPLERSGSELLIHARCWVLRGRALIGLVFELVVVGGCSSRAFSVSAGWWVWGRYRPYFENYTVDASIFESILHGSAREDDLKDH